MLTHQQTTILESAWEILDKLRNCRDFNEIHDVSLGDVCMGLGEFLDWQYERDRQCQHQQPLPSVDIESLESFNRL